MEKLYTVKLYTAKTRPGADCGLDHELLLAKFRLKWKKVRKTTRPFKYDLNQIPFQLYIDKKIQGIRSDRVPDELWREVCDILQERGIKTIPSKRNAKQQNGCLLEKSVCRSGSNSSNWTRNNRLGPNRKRSTSRLYIVTLLI